MPSSSVSPVKTASACSQSRVRQGALPDRLAFRPDDAIGAVLLELLAVAAVEQRVVGVGRDFEDDRQAFGRQRAFATGGEGAVASPVRREFPRGARGDGPCRLGPDLRPACFAAAFGASGALLAQLCGSPACAGCFCHSVRDGATKPPRATGLSQDLGGAGPQRLVDRDAGREILQRCADRLEQRDLVVAAAARSSRRAPVRAGRRRCRRGRSRSAFSGCTMSPASLLAPARVSTKIRARRIASSSLSRMSGVKRADEVDMDARPQQRALDQRFGRNRRRRDDVGPANCGIEVARNRDRDTGNVEGCRDLLGIGSRPVPDADLADRPHGGMRPAPETAPARRHR